MNEYYESNIKQAKEKNPRIRKIAMMAIVVLLFQVVLLSLTIINEDLFNVGVMASTTEEYNIGTAQELWDFAAEVNGGNTFSGITVNLTADIDLECSEDNQWIPIAYEDNLYINPSVVFSGIFEGNNHYIEGVYINSESECQGLFGVVSGEINNLTYKNSTISVTNSHSKVGGIVGYLKEGATVNNCVNYATVYSDASADRYGTIGGIVGENHGGTINNCVNYGKITGYVAQIGGIAGNSTGTIYQCENYGILDNLSTNGSYNAEGTGGITGCNYSAGNVLLCNNNSAMEISGKSMTGGIVGNNFGGTISNCQNNKSIESASNFGGIAGYSWSDSKIQFCQNNGEIRGNQSSVRCSQGGIVGIINGATIGDCQNNGKIICNSTFNFIGGIAGTFRNGEKGRTIKNCFNKAEITVNADNENVTVGGIIGYVDYSSSYETTKNIIGCYNTGNIVINNDTGLSTGVTGGIIGEVCSAQGKTIIKNCYNLGNIDAVGATAGGVIGQTLTTNGHSIADSIDIINCYNKGNVDCFTKNWTVSVGGIVGDNRSYFSDKAIITIFNCYNQGTISGEASLEGNAVCYMGGITGFNYVGEESTGKICNTYNTGIISAKGRKNEYAGAIYGRNMGDVSNSYYLETTISNATEINEGTSSTEKSTAEFMKSDEFVTKLNNNTEDWKMDSENINNGYPILSKILEVDKIEMTTKPTKTTYIQNQEKLDLTGGIITITYNDESTDTISLTNEKVKVTGFDNTKIGKVTLTVEYEGNITTFDIEIISKQITEIEVTTRPTKTTYIHNYETLDLTNGIITVTYNDGSTSTVNLTNENVTVTGFDNTTVGTNTLTVKYGGKTTTFDIEIISKQAIGIEVTTKPTKTTYIQNREKLDLTGGIVTITYNDGSTGTISLTNENVKVTKFDNTKAGKVILTVEYCGNKTTFEIKIISENGNGSDNKEEDNADDTAAEVVLPNTGGRNIIFIVITLILIIIVIFNKKYKKYKDI